jgi:hypothetical protein
VVVDPAAFTVTHLIVKQPQRDGARRLVPVRLTSTETAAIKLRCPLAQLEGLRSAGETQTLPGGPW